MAGFQNDPSVIQQEAGFGFFGRFWTESFNDGMTAKASGTQANSTLIDSMYCRFTTVASAGDGALLPGVTPFPGGALIICVTNATTNPMTVYASGNDTINGQAGSTGVQQMANSIVYYQCSSAGKWFAVGLGVGFAQSASMSAAFPTYSNQTGITATGSGTQANSIKITGQQVQISVCGSLNDSVTMPPAVAGMEVTIVNNGAQNAKVWPASQAQGGVTGGDQINALGQNTGFTPITANAAPTIFYCFVTGTWLTK